MDGSIKRRRRSSPWINPGVSAPNVFDEIVEILKPEIAEIPPEDDTEQSADIEFAEEADVLLNDDSSIVSSENVEDFEKSDQLSENS